MECYNNRGRFLIEAILWWLIIALPINLASIFFSIQAPAYIHTDHINNGTNDFNTSLGIMISYSKIQFAVTFILGVVHKLRLQDEVGRWLSKCQQMSTGVGRWSVLCQC